MSRISAKFYTKGKFGKSFRETIDTYNEHLYSRGQYPTKIRKEDLPKEYRNIITELINSKQFEKIPTAINGLKHELGGEYKAIKKLNTLQGYLSKI